MVFHQRVMSVYHSSLCGCWGSLIPILTSGVQGLVLVGFIAYEHSAPHSPPKNDELI